MTGTSGSTVMCISPLTSLVMDQCAKYTPRGLQAEFVGEAQTDRAVKEKVLRGEIPLLFITPESLIGNSTCRNMLLSPAYTEKLVALVIDEAHCVQTWGEEFRVAFAQIGDLRSLIPKRVNVMALTATATSVTFSAVCSRLAMDKPTLIAFSPNRDNIRYQVHPKLHVDKLTTILCDKIISKRTSFPKTIIYFIIM